MSSKQNVGDEEMKGDQQPSLKEVVRGYLKSVPDEKLQEVVQKLENEAGVYTREELLEKSRETLKDVLGAAAGGSLYDALHKSGKISVVLYVVLSLPSPAAAPLFVPFGRCVPCPDPFRARPVAPSFRPLAVCLSLLSSVVPCVRVCCGVAMPRCFLFVTFGLSAPRPFCLSCRAVWPSGSN